MKLQDAIAIILDLASEFALTENEMLQDKEALQDQYNQEQEAMAKVAEFLDAFRMIGHLFENEF